jgi:hypothetical protein
VSSDLPLGEEEEEEEEAVGVAAVPMMEGMVADTQVELGFD